MKKIEAIIAPGRLDDVQEALSAGGIDALTVSQVNAYNGKPGHVEMYRGVRYETDFHSRVKVELELDDGQVPIAVDVLERAGQINGEGDEFILVLAIETCVEIEDVNHGATVDLPAFQMPASPSVARSPITISL